MGVGACLDAERVDLARPRVVLPDLGVPADDQPPNSYRLRTTDYSWPRFPARVAVARVTLSDQPVPAGEPRLIFSALRPVERPPWIESLIDIPEVSELFFLQPTSFSRAYSSTTDVANAARSVDANLCLIFAQSDLGDESARAVGLLIDTRTLQVVATLTSSVEPKLRGFEVDRPKNRHEKDNRHVDPRFLADEAFRRLMHDCLLDLIVHEAGPTASARRGEPFADRAHVGS